MSAKMGADHSGMLDRVAAEICRRTGAQRSAVVYGEDHNERIHFAAASGPGAERLTGARGPAEGSGLCGNVLAGSRSILSRTTLGDPRVHQAHTTELGITTALGVPVNHDGQPFAVLMALNREDGETFTETEQLELEGYAAEVAEDLWNARPCAT
jgi:GAF domain-containing protein